MTKLRNLNRNVLIALIAALLVLEAGLIWAGAQALRRSAAPSAVAPTPAAVKPRPTTTPAPGKPTPAPVQTPAVQPVVREPGPAVASGDLLAVARAFDAEEAMEFVEALAAPELGGRQPGTDGGRAAGEYIAQKFQEFGLQPAGTDGYFQPFTVPFAEITGVPTFVFTTTTGTVYDDFVYRKDFAFAWGGYAGGGTASGRVVWANDCRAEDLRGVDVAGQIAFCRFSASDEVYRQALEHGASGLILLTDAESRVDRIRTYRQPNYLPKSLPTLIVLPQVAEALLADSGYTLDDLSLLYRAVPLNVSAHFEVLLNEPGEAEARNVLGVLPGRDPTQRDKVVIIGAHYDHLGTDANGDIYRGANDNASGTAALLEVARSWQAAGFVPDTTVLFAAWDAEEQGLLGAEHYVQNPRYPLTATVGMIQLDMVGLASDGILTLDGINNAVGRQLQASAALFGVTTGEVSFQGGSDHAAFLRANVPAALLIWDNADVPYYHTPQDTPDTLQPERLRQAGAIASHAAIVLSTVQPRLRALLDSQAQAIAAGDADAYTATLDPADAALRQAGQDWLATRPVDVRQGYTLTVSNLLVSGDTAQADVAAASLDKDGRRSVLATYPAQMVRRAAEWYATWPIASTIKAPALTVQMVRASETDQEWADSLAQARLRVALALGLRNPQPITLTVYPDRNTFSWLAGAGTGAYSPLPGYHIARTDAITPTAVNLVRAELGMLPQEGAWLGVGLIRWIAAAGDPDAQRALARETTPLLDGTVSAQGVLTLTADAFDERSSAVAWSLTDYFMRTYGPDGVRKFCAGWARTGTQAGAFAALGTTPDAFAQAWETAVMAPLAEARAGIDQTLRQREDAVRAGDKAAFLATVNPDDAVFLTEEGHWFDDLAKHPVSSYDLNAQLLALDEGGALVNLEMSAALKESGKSIHAWHPVRFVKVGDRWVLAGPDWTAEQGEHFVVKYTPPTTQETARAVLDAAERAYAQVTADLDYAPASVTEIKLYDDQPAMLASILLSVPSWAKGWYEPGEAIKIWTGAKGLDFVSLIAHEFTHRALFDLGVDLEWLHEGVAVFESMRAAPETAASAQARYVPAVREAQRTQKLLDWANMPTYDQVAEQDTTLYYGQSWMFVNEFVRQFGLDSLNRLLRAMGEGRGFAQAFAVAARMPFSDWEPQWQEAVRLGGVPAELIRAAQGFSTDRALETVRTLASEDFAGRRAGSPGAEAAARWIAEQMQALGLQPGAPDGSFFQAVPVSYAELTAMPAVRFTDAVTGGEVALAYGEDFREVVGGFAGGGDRTAELVWLPKEFPEGVRLGGRIALKYQSADPAAEAEAAWAHGAGGLILVVKDASLNMRERTVPSRALNAETIPVVQIQESTWRDLIKMAGLTPYEANNAPRALLLSLKARLTVPYSAPQAAQALTVIGVLPGERADARPLVIGAHYDGVGSLPDGTLYPGANKNASGVGVMLEVARVLAEGGFRPSRPIYFVAWGAEEAGLASSRLYADQPPVPLEGILSLLELDTVGAARSYYLNLEGEKDGLEATLLFNLRLAADLLERRVSPEAYKGGNTHAVFRDRGVPSVLLFWPNAENLHTPLDAPDTLDPYKLATTGEVTTLAAMMMAR
ncbi:MAG: hypothetical protein Kow00123_16710 [Anaerolineales bacterium]